LVEVVEEVVERSGRGKSSAARKRERQKLKYDASIGKQILEGITPVISGIASGLSGGSGSGSGGSTSGLGSALTGLSSALSGIDKNIQGGSTTSSGGDNTSTWVSAIGQALGTFLPIIIEACM